jgi:hypothetical protein
LASDAFIMANLNRRNWNTIFFYWDWFNTIDGTKGYADLTSGAIILVNDCHEFRFLFLKINLFCRLGDRFVMIVARCVFHNKYLYLGTEVKRKYFLSPKAFFNNIKNSLISCRF